MHKRQYFWFHSQLVVLVGIVYFLSMYRLESLVEGIVFVSKLSATKYKKIRDWRNCVGCAA